MAKSTISAVFSRNSLKNTHFLTEYRFFKHCFHIIVWENYFWVPLASFLHGGVISSQNYHSQNGKIHLFFGVYTQIGHICVQKTIFKHLFLPCCVRNAFLSVLGNFPARRGQLLMKISCRERTKALFRLYSLYAWNSTFSLRKQLFSHPFVGFRFKIVINVVSDVSSREGCVSEKTTPDFYEKSSFMGCFP